MWLTNSLNSIGFISEFIEIWSWKCQPSISLNSIGFISEMDRIQAGMQTIQIVEFAWFYKRIGWSIDCPQFVKFDWFYKWIRRVATRKGNHARRQNSIGFISELDEMWMLPNSLNSIGFISEFDELATHSGTFVNSLNSLCFTSELGGIHQSSNSLNSLCFSSEFRCLQSTRAMSQELQIRNVFLANSVSKFVYGVRFLGRRISYRRSETIFARFYSSLESAGDEIRCVS